MRETECPGAAPQCRFQGYRKEAAAGKGSYIRELEGILQENLGTKVRIHPGKKRKD